MRRVWSRVAAAMVVGVIDYSFTAGQALAAGAGEALKLLRKVLAKQRA